MIKLQFKLPQALVSRGFTRRTVFHAPAFQQKGINRLMDIYQIWKLNFRLGIRCGPLSKHPLPPARHLPHLTIASIRPTFPGINPDQEMRQCINKSFTMPHINTQYFGTYSIKLKCIYTWHSFSKEFSSKNLSEQSISIIKKLIAKYYLDSYILPN